jgi:hypothetical protein
VPVSCTLLGFGATARTFSFGFKHHNTVFRWVADETRRDVKKTVIWLERTTLPTAVRTLKTNPYVIEIWFDDIIHFVESPSKLTKKPSGGRRATAQHLGVASRYYSADWQRGTCLQEARKLDKL